MKLFVVVCLFVVLQTSSGERAGLKAFACPTTFMVFITLPSSSTKLPDFLKESTTAD